MLSASLADRLRRFRKSEGEFDSVISEYEKLQQEIDVRFDRSALSDTHHHTMKR
jgi:sulfatase maturation enzyme AslB (radical SAM superfamily)